MSSTLGQAPEPGAEIAALAERMLRGRVGWSKAQRRGAAQVANALIGDIPDGDYSAVGLAGAPGSGKSALAKLICALLEALATPALVLSLDDYYLGRESRETLAHRHPLFAQRGAPGTHEWETLIEHLDRLRRGDIESLRLPRFDKSLDDRAEESEFRRLDSRPRMVILEGWLVGAPPQETRDLLEPANALEAERDPDGRWRAVVNERLAEYHRDLRERLDRFWFLAVPGWDCVVDWRWQQECERADGRSYLENRAEVAAFLDPFQRIALHMLATCRQWADVVVRIDERHVMHVD